MQIVEAGNRTGTVKAISSKSHVHRLLICSALSKENTVIKDVTFSKDILATINCLDGLLADIKIENDVVHIFPYNKPCEKKELDLCESGSTYRFLVPIICALGIKTSFTGAKRLAERPLSPLYELLIEHGASLSEKGLFPLVCNGNISAGEYTISGEVSSQFISGLIFALPLLDGDSVINVTGKMESYPYIKMTLDAVKLFGIEVIEDTNKFIIRGNQKYVSPQNIIAEGDWSNAAFFACMGAISQKGITIKNLNSNSIQGDKEIINILSKMGAEIIWENNSVTVKKNKLTGTQIDASQIPDLVPVLATISTVAKGKTVIYNAERLRIKESDRIESVYSMLEKLGADIEKTEDGFIIYGKDNLSGGIIRSENDHRIVMSGAVASCMSTNPLIIDGEEAVTKSYPHFFKDFNALKMEK